MDGFWFFGWLHEVVYAEVDFSPLEDISSDECRASKFDRTALQRTSAVSRVAQCARAKHKRKNKLDDCLKSRAAWSAQPRDIDQSHAHRMQMLSNFIDLMFPDPKVGNVSSLLRVSFMRAIPDQDLSLPVLRHTVEALCLAGLGLNSNDKRLVYESHRRYATVLRLLGPEVIRTTKKSSGGDRVQQRSVLMAIVLSIVCEYLDRDRAEASGSGRAWLLHVKGAEHYLQACGPEIITSDFDHLLFHNLRLFALFTGISQREATIFAEPRWLEIAERKRYGTISLYDLGMQVPGLLERCELMFALRHSLQDERRYMADREASGLSAKMRQLLLDIAALRTELDKWQADQSSALGEKAMWSEEPIDEGQPFPTSFRFHSIRHAVYHVHLWGYMLILDRALLRIAYFAPWAVTQETAADVKADAVLLASNTARSMPSFLIDSSSARIMGKGSIQMAIAIFKLFGMKAEVEFCRSWDFDVDDMALLHKLAGGFPATERNSYWDGVFNTGRIYGQQELMEDSDHGTDKADSSKSSPRCDFEVETVHRERETVEPLSPTPTEVLRWQKKRSCSFPAMAESTLHRDAAIRGWLFDSSSPPRPTALAS